TGTGEWLLEADGFESWVGGKGKALWLPGIPGAGKTVLASMVIEYLRNIQRQQPACIGLAWVYFNYKEESTQSPDAILLSITRQLADFSTVLYNHFKSAYKKNPHNRPSPSQLLADDILIRGFEKTFVVVDALDECGDNNRDDFLEMMARLQVSGANIIITSREHVSDHLATSALVDVQRIGIHADSEDLAKYVEGCMQKQTRLANILRKDPSLRQEIVTTITESCEGMFLVARLQIESLRKHTTAVSIRTALRTLPTTIENIYDEALHRIETDDWSEDALSVLSCLVYAQRLLKVEELQHFLAIRPGLADLQEEHLTSRETLISMCAGLVVIDDSAGIIRLVHFTAQEYFEQRRNVHFPRGDEEMGRKCLAYLCLDAIRNFDWNSTFMHYNSDTGKDEWNIIEASKIVIHHALLDYVVEYWCFHILPHHDVLGESLLNSPNFNAKNQSGWSFLWVAYREGHESAMKFLLDNNVDVNTRHSGWPESTLSMVASKRGHSAVVKLLLEHGANIEAQNKDGMTALMKASLEGHRMVVQLLLEQGAKIEGRDRWGMTALMKASIEGHSEVVQLLLEHGANIEAQDEVGRTALMSASSKGHSEVVQLLLGKGANIEAQDKDGTTALMKASKKGCSMVVQLLLEHGANIEAQDGDKMTALMEALWYGHSMVVQLLLEHGANIKAQDGDKMTALMEALWYGHSMVVQLLLEHGANIKAQDGDKMTALMEASRNGHSEVVQLLLEHGANIEVQDEYGTTTLMEASVWGNSMVVQLLLEHSANIEVQDEAGRTVLMLASRNGHNEVVQLLLEHGANIEAQNANRTTALMEASMEGHSKVVQLLLEHGAKIEGRDRWGMTALMWASIAGHSEVVQLLLEHGANIEVKDGFGTTALMHASWGAKSAVVELLLECGANDEVQNNDGKTALNLAEEGAAEEEQAAETESEDSWDRDRWERKRPKYAATTPI
ncbi:ankyrin repeat-containing domain protein, partial [Mycena crocata]